MNQNIKVIPLKPSQPQSNRKTAKNQLMTGTFPAEIVDVDQAPDYDQDEAVQITYMVDTGTKSVEYKEIFINDQRNSRTNNFINQLSADGVSMNSWDELVGVKVEVTFKKQVKYGRTYLNIVAYKF